MDEQHRKRIELNTNFQLIWELFGLNSTFLLTFCRIPIFRFDFENSGNSMLR